MSTLPLTVDLFAIAQRWLIALWACAAAGIFAFEYFSRRARAKSPGSPSVQWLRLSALGVCLLAWFLVPDTFAVEARSEAAFVRVHCLKTEQDWHCDDGRTVTQAVEPGTVSSAYSYRFAFLGIHLHLEPDSR